MKRVRVNIRVAELDAMSDAILRLYKEDTSVVNDEYLKDLMSKIETLSAKLTTSIKADRILSNLDEKNAQRDDVLSKLIKLVNGYTAIPDVSKQAAGDVLNTILNKYRGITKENYKEKSSHITSLLEDLKTKDADDAIKKLDGVSYLVMRLEVSNSTFNQVSDDYVKATSIQTESASSIKKTMLSIINDDMVPFFTVMYKVNKGTYGRLIENIDKEIERTNAVVAKHSKSTDKTSDKDGVIDEPIKEDSTL